MSDAPPPPPGDPYAPPAYQTVGYPPAYQPAGYAGYGQPQPPRGLSIASMVLGIVGVVFGVFYGLGLFPSIAAVITGHLAQRRQPQGRGFWLAGLITGYLGLFFSLLGVAFLIVFIIVIAHGTSDTSTFGGLSNS
jgi:Domain of unknown function (DUF4190)